MDHGGGPPPPPGPRGRGVSRGEALQKLLAEKQALRRPGAVSSPASGEAAGPPPMTPDPGAVAASSTPSIVSLPPPTGRAALLSSLRPPGPIAAVGRAELLQKLKNQGLQGPSAPSEGRATMLANLRAAQVARKRDQSGASGPPHSILPSAAGDVKDVDEKPPSAVSETDSAETRLVGGLETLKMGEGSNVAPVVRKGESGQPIKLSANHIRLELESDKAMCEYEVKFNPPVDSKDERHKLVNQHRETLGHTKTFDGICLYLPDKMEKDVTVLKGRHPQDDSEVMMTLTLKHKKKLGDRACVQFYNNLFRRIMVTLKMVQMNKNHYDPTLAHMVPQHKLEIWPGYVTAVHEYEGGVMLNLDVSHKVLRTSTAYELLKDISKKDAANFHANAQKALLGAIVLTRYNNKNYKVDDIDFKMNCTSTFTDHNGEEKTFLDYYKKHYGIVIKEPKQPLLISRSKRKRVEMGDVQETVCLVPELCNLTGLTDQMKADFRVMKDVAQFTRITPAQRLQAYQKFLDNVNNSAEASALLLNWGLRLAKGAISLEGRKLAPEKLVGGKGLKIDVNAKADWTREITTNQCLNGVKLQKWAVIYVNKNAAVVQNFSNLMVKLSPKMGIKVAQPIMKELPNDRTETFVQMIRDSVDPTVQLVCVIMPTPRDDRYAAVKKLCCVEKPVASQVINFKTISNEKKVSSVVQKVALQINCKLGGELWGCTIPMPHLMVVGVDVYHDPSRKSQSIAGIVSSTNKAMSQWYSSVCFQASGQELIDTLKPAFIRAIKQFHKVNQQWPAQILVFRDGVGDSQLSILAKYEAEQLRDTFRHISDDYQPSFGFVVVQKRINTRIFAMGGREADNPPPGTIMDHTVTKRDWYDFFLVSQHVGQGTVSPTHYIVLYDNTGLKPDIIQKISYKLTHMYYNWPGTVRVPAPCQYASKMAYLVGEHIHKEPSGLLNDRLYYL